MTFDGTGISVFELKRDIISISRLGDGTDFELIITAEDTNEGRYIYHWYASFGSNPVCSV